jgi:putative peptidoglycan lipid II flippase
MENEIALSDDHTKKVPQAALKVALGGGLSLLAGLASQVATAYLFGAGTEMDAFFTALTIPLYLQIVLLGGLPFVVIPAFVTEENAGNEEAAWSLTGTLIWVSGIFLFLIAFACAIYSRFIIDITAPGFGDSKSELASQMLAIIIFSVPFMGLSSFTSGVQNIRGKFFSPATATAIGSIGNLVILLSLHSTLGPIALAWGSLGSAVLQSCVTAIPVIRHGWNRLMPIGDPRLKEMFKLITPFILFGLITSSRLILERFFASGLPNGQISYLGYANKISNIFVILLATSIASAIFPAMARSFAKDSSTGLVRQFDYGLSVTFAVALPSVTIISALSIPLIKSLFERGAFQEGTTLSISLIIPIVMINDVLFRMINNMIQRTYYVLKDTLTTNLISSLTILLYIICAKMLTARWGYMGLAFAQPIQMGFNILIVSLLLAGKLKDLPVKKLFRNFFRYLVVSLAASFIGWMVTMGIYSWHPIIQLVSGGTISVAAYLFLLRKVDPSMAVSIFEMTGLQKIFTVIQKRYVLMHQATRMR